MDYLINIVFAMGYTKGFAKDISFDIKSLDLFPRKFDFR
jgi:hypothetical protein